MSARALAACALLALAALVAPAAARERILDFDSTIAIRADGGMDVVETLRVRAEGLEIRRGIVREFPVRYRDRHGHRVVVAFEVQEVLRDGRPEPWFTERAGDSVLLATGGDALLPVPADITYTLRYRTDRQLGFFDAHDELYWNAIPLGRSFPVEAGRIEVSLPAPVPAEDLRLATYTGPYGAADNAHARAEVVAPGTARWTLERPLAGGEGLTLVLGFPKGVVAEPGLARRAGWLLRDNLHLLVALLGLLALAAYCYARWRQVGRDPAAGTLVVRYEPPPGHSPGSARYLRRMGQDMGAFTADLLASAVDGAVEIHREDSGKTERWRVTAGRGEASTAPQRALLDGLLDEGPLELDNEQAERIQEAIARHRKALDAAYGGLFQRNGGSVAIAVAIALVAGLAAWGIGAANGGALLWLLPFAVAMLAVVIAFGRVIGAPSPEGRRVLDALDGFQRYLEVAERPDLERLAGPGADGEPPLDAARFERLLPWAVALEVEDAWTARFTSAVGAAAAAEAVAAMPWYHGPPVSSPGGLAQALGPALKSQIAAASIPPPAPGSSSGLRGSGGGGFGGGGFSGGGGGGGGIGGR